MKVLKFFGVLFICLGCMAAFVGVAAAVLPMIRNDQLQLVLASFAAPDDNILVNAMNAAMTYALRNCYVVMLSGAGVATAGVLMLLGAGRSASRREAEARARRRQADPRANHRPTSQPIPGEAAPAWRASKAPDATARNPFAARMASDMMAYRAENRATARAAAPEAVNTFAPAVQRKPEVAPAVWRGEEPSAYGKPEAAPVSPYARPEPAAAYAPQTTPSNSASAAVPSPYARLEPVADTLFSARGQEEATADPLFAPRGREATAAVSAVSGPEAAMPYAPLTTAPASAAPMPDVPPRPVFVAASVPAPAARQEEAYQPLFEEQRLWTSAAPQAAPTVRPEAPPEAPPAAQTRLPGGWATPDRAGWLTPKAEEAASLVATPQAMAMTAQPAVPLTAAPLSPAPQPAEAQPAQPRLDMPLSPAAVSPTAAAPSLAAVSAPLPPLSPGKALPRGGARAPAGPRIKSTMGKHRK